MKIQEQINFIKVHKRFRLDFLDIILMGVTTISLAMFNYLFYYLYRNMGMSFWWFIIIEAFLICLIILFITRFIDSFSFKEVNTQLPFESTKSIIIAYLKSKGLEVIYSPVEDSLLMTHIISFGLTIKQKEMTLVCMDDLVLMNIRPVVGKDIFGYRKEHKRYKTEIEAFIRHRHGAVSG